MSQDSEAQERELAHCGTSWIYSENIQKNLSNLGAEQWKVEPLGKKDSPSHFLSASKPWSLSQAFRQSWQDSLGFKMESGYCAPQAAVAEIIVVRGTDKGEQREGNHYQAWERRSGQKQQRLPAKRNELEGPVNSFTAAPLERQLALATRRGIEN